MKNILFILLFICVIACANDQKQTNEYNLNNVEWKAKWEQRKDSTGITDTIKFNSVYNWETSGEGTVFYVANNVALRYEAPFSGIFKLSLLVEGENITTQIGKGTEYIYKFRDEVNLTEVPLEISLNTGEWFWINIFGLAIEHNITNVKVEILDVTF